MVYIGEHGPSPKAEKALRSKPHSRFIHELPCCLSGSMQNIIQHHLLRCPSRAGRSGDQHSVPMTDSLHKELHDNWGDERAFFAAFDIYDPVSLAVELFANTGNFDKCLEILESAKGKQPLKNCLGIKHENL